MNREGPRGDLSSTDRWDHLSLSDSVLSQDLEVVCNGDPRNETLLPQKGTLSSPLTQSRTSRDRLSVEACRVDPPPHLGFL